jgi:LuxR family maltose regulon positive regulatory protein
VLSRQPAEIRRFLARTAVLTRFCAPLCDAVIGSSDAAKIIEVLERENLFVVPLDDSREWYRYHHLFAQVLRAELVRTEPEVIPALHQRACTWHRWWGQSATA